MTTPDLILYRTPEQNREIVVVFVSEFARNISRGDSYAFYSKLKKYDVVDMTRETWEASGRVVEVRNLNHISEFRGHDLHKPIPLELLP